jgi:XTP/dITP diphosphohydrolase
MMEVNFVTGNAHKFGEAKLLLARFGIGCAHVRRSLPEIRSDNVEDVARASAEFAYNEIKKPLFVEDSGLFIDEFKGFPGPYSAWAQGKLGNAGILKLMEGAKSRSATFRACVFYADGKESRAFLGECPGAITAELRGKAGFGYDPIFVPRGYACTFSENEKVKNNVSHRVIALTAFARWYANYIAIKAVKK